MVRKLVFDFSAKEARYNQFSGPSTGFDGIGQKVREALLDRSVCCMLQVWWISLAEDTYTQVGLDEAAYRWCFSRVLTRILPTEGHARIPNILSADWAHDSFKTPRVLRPIFFCSLLHLFVQFSASIFLSCFDFLRIIHSSVFDSPGGPDGVVFLRRVENIREVAARHLCRIGESTAEECPAEVTTLFRAAVDATEEIMPFTSNVGRMLSYVRGGGLAVEREMIREQQMLSSGSNDIAPTRAGQYQTFDMLLAFVKVDPLMQLDFNCFVSSRARMQSCNVPTSSSLARPQPNRRKTHVQHTRNSLAVRKSYTPALLPRPPKARPATSRTGGSARWNIPWETAPGTRPATSSGASLLVLLHNRVRGKPVPDMTPTPPRRERLRNDPRVLPDSFVLCRNALYAKELSQHTAVLQADRKQAEGDFTKHMTWQKGGAAVTHLYRNLKRFKLCEPAVPPRAEAKGGG